MLRRFLYCTVLLLGGAFQASAQLDQEEAIRSLADVGSFGIVVDVEATRALASDDALDNASIRDRMSGRIELLSGRRPTLDPLETGNPYLYVHLNVLDVGDGLVPFAVNATFIQPVRLAAGGHRIMSVTWEAGSVGLVSFDRLATIVDTAEALVEEFAEDLVVSGGGS